ncbi:MAG: coproporphyrinogen-III oxidase family protein [Acidobacteriota bacterium]|nr:coproporphyrinogen-III oxidase family protein [Acidobacteriota bacterium]
MSTVEEKKNKTEVGSVFISNYPPYSVWTDDKGSELEQAFETPGDPEKPMGLYLHIPFCRKRCKFCYFKVYTDKNSREIQAYIDAVEKEIGMIARRPAVAGRKLKFLYVGGGTPSYISGRHLRGIMDHIKAALPWDDMEEVTFECEPGTLTEKKLEIIKEVGVTRLSLGVENFDDDILSENGRAHISTEVYKVHPWIKKQGFDQLNIDLISGMVGETWENWKANIEKAIDYDPDSITIYQMELPFNTVYSGRILNGEEGLPDFADWKVKREWHNYAMERLQEAGYAIASGYTMVKRDKKVSFGYRDHLWRGADLLALGCSAFGHIQGVHYQNQPSIVTYTQMVEEGRQPLRRAYVPTEEERLVREMILQMKLGYLYTAYFQEKYGVDILEKFQDQFAMHKENGMLDFGNGKVTLTRAGLLRVDSLLPAFYDAKYQNTRYT